MMNNRTTLLIAGGLAAVCGLFLWKSLPRRNAAPSPAAPQQAAAPMSPAHERASLVEQLARKPGHTPVLFRLAQIDLESARPAEARRWLEQLLAAEPGNLDARLELGRAHYQLGDANAARVQTEKILASDPRHPDALYNLGAMAANEGRLAEARAFWTRAVEAAHASESGRKAASALARLPVQSLPR